MLKNVDFIKEAFHVVAFCCNKKIHKDGKPSRNELYLDYESG